MTTAIIYARVSSKRQADDGISMDAQIEQCTARARQLGANVLRVFRDDGISGRTVEARPAFRAALEYCSVGSVKYFIVWSTSRFARNAIDLWVHQDALKVAGTRLECLNADIDDETDAGFINRVFLGAMDQMLSRQIGRDTLRSLKASAAEGYFTGGHTPFGYRKVADGKRSRLQVHPDEAPTVERAFFMALNEELGAQAIALRLNEANLLHHGKRWGKNSVAYLLKNEVYTGVKTFNRTFGKTKKPKPREEWVQVPSHPAIVTREDFEQVQRLMELRTPHDHGGAQRSCFVFTGLLKCGICSEPLQIINGTSRSGALYSYYSCMGHKKGAVRCLFKNLRADTFDDWLMGQLLDKVLNPQVMRQAMEEVATMGGEWLKERETRRARLVSEVRDIESRRNKLYDVLETGGRDTPDLADVTARLRARNSELLELQEQLVALEAQPAPAKLPKLDPGLAVDVMRDVIMEGDAKKKRAFLGAFLEGASVAGESVTVEYRPDALVRVGHDASVRSTCTWLPEKHLLRTKTVQIRRDGYHIVKRRARAH